MSVYTRNFLDSFFGEESIPAPKIYSTKVLTNETRKKILPYQENHIVKLINILLNKHIALDHCLFLSKHCCLTY
jgi:hypothetical protein